MDVERLMNALINVQKINIGQNIAHLAGKEVLDACDLYIWHLVNNDLQWLHPQIVILLCINILLYTYCV